MNAARSTTGGTGRELFAWAMYDWANSAFSTLSITFLLIYLQQEVFPETGVLVWSWGIGIAMLAVAILSPIVGAVADATSSKRRWLSGTALGGAGCAILLAAVPPSYPWLIAGLFVATTFLFNLSLVFYNGFLPEIADVKSMNRVSAWGFALGYVGGGLALAIGLLIFAKGESWGLGTLASQLRAGLLVMGVWWGVFSLPAIFWLHDRKPARSRETSKWGALTTATREVGRTLRNIRAYRVLAIFLVAFLFYNDGVQTVISQASTLASKDFGFEPTELGQFILMVQFVAFPGALLVGWLADRLGQKTVLVGCLLIWLGVLVAVFAWVETKPQFWAVGVVAALVLGGVQSVSRALMGMITPPEHAAEFFGFFNSSGKATSFIGNFTFGLVAARYQSARLGILSLVVQFVIGLALLALVNVEEGKKRSHDQRGG